MSPRYEIPDSPALDLNTLVLDANGTLAGDGDLLEGVAERLNRLAASFRIVIITADTFGRARNAFAPLPAELVLLEPGAGAGQKLEFIVSAGPGACAAVGNGANDHLMLAEAALGIAVVGPEGAAAKTVAAADVVVKDIRDALDLLLHPARLAATLRL